MPMQGNLMGGQGINTGGPLIQPLNMGQGMPGVNRGFGQQTQMIAPNPGFQNNPNPNYGTGLPNNFTGVNNLGRGQPNFNGGNNNFGVGSNLAGMPNMNTNGGNMGGQGYNGYQGNNPGGNQVRGIWKWDCEDGTKKPYEEPIQSQIEYCFQNSTECFFEVNTDKGKKRYKIDFQNMKQVNIDTNFLKKIYRE